MLQFKPNSQMEKPQIKAMRRFLGMASYYRRFVPDFATIAAPFTSKKEPNQITWTKDRLELQQALTKTVTLHAPDYIFSKQMPLKLYPLQQEAVRC